MAPRQDPKPGPPRPGPRQEKDPRKRPSEGKDDKKFIFKAGKGEKYTRQELIAKLMKENRCFTCHKPGHMKGECPEDSRKDTKNPQGKRVRFKEQDKHDRWKKRALLNEAKNEKRQEN